MTGPRIYDPGYPGPADLAALSEPTTCRQCGEDLASGCAPECRVDAASRTLARLEADDPAPPTVCRWRVRDGEAITLHRDRSAAIAAVRRDGGLPERLPWPVEVEAPPAIGLRPCPACPAGWMRAIAGDAGEVLTADGPRDPDADLILGCPACGHCREALALGIGEAL